MPYFAPCRIDYDGDLDGVLGGITKGEITWLGESPHARVKVSEYDNARRRLVQVDIITEATVQEGTDRVKVTGVSRFLQQKVGLAPSEAKVALTAERTRKACCS